MLWEREGWVRLYRRHTPEWLAVSWQARAFFGELLKLAEYAGPNRGLVILGPKGLRAIAGAVHWPLDVVEAAVAELIEDGCVLRVEGGLMLRNYVVAQDTPKSASLRNSEYRHRTSFETKSLASETKSLETETARDGARRRETARAQKEESEEEQEERTLPPTPSPPGEGGDIGSDSGVAEPAELTRAQREKLRDVAMAAAYSAGVSARTGRPHLVEAKHHLTLRSVVTTHAKGLRLAALDAWLTERGSAYAKARPDARFEAGYSVPRFLDWLNAGAPDATPPTNVRPFPPQPAGRPLPPINRAPRPVSPQPQPAPLEAKVPAE